MDVDADWAVALDPFNGEVGDTNRAAQDVAEPPYLRGALE
jgi:hypothetical protein